MSRPRIRYIKPEIWLSRDFRSLTVIGRLTFIALISNADDDGRLKTDPAHLAMTYLPGCEPFEIAVQLQAMEERRMVMTYTVRNVHYLAVLGWAAHQRVNHYVASDLPEPPKFKRGGPVRVAQLTFKKRTRQTYFMLRADNQVKIGISRDVAARKQALELAAGPLTLLATTVGGYSESWYRKTFSALHTHGEWFRYEEPLCSHIAELIAGSENKEIDNSHKSQNEIGILSPGIPEVSSPARLRSSSSSSSTVSSTVSSTRQDLTVLSRRPSSPTDESAVQLVEAFTQTLTEWSAKRRSSPRKDLEAAERLLRIDGRQLDEALAVLGWATHDSFWRPNILSLDKFREKYDTLRGQMERGARREHPADARVRQLGEMALRFEAEGE